MAGSYADALHPLTIRSGQSMRSSTGMDRSLLWALEATACMPSCEGSLSVIRISCLEGCVQKKGFTKELCLKTGTTLIRVSTVTGTL